MEKHAESGHGGPEHIMQLIQGVQASGILKASIELDVFSRIAKGKKTSREIASDAGTPVRSTGLLLNAAAALGLLAKKGDEYALTPATEQFLVRGKPTYMGDLSNVFMSDMLWNNSSHIADCVKKDGTVLGEHAETPRHPFWELFAKNTAAIAGPASMALNALIGDWIDKRGAKVRVLDIAAGSGLYGYALAKHPNVELTLLDWPNVLTETKEWGKRTGADMSRVKTIEGNLFDVDFGTGYDVVLMSHIFHHFDEATCEKLMVKAGAAVAPNGGRLVVHDFLYDETLANPMGALFSITMLTWTRKGQAYAQSNYESWFRSAGLKSAGVHPSGGMPSAFVLAEKA